MEPNERHDLIVGSGDGELDGLIILEKKRCREDVEVQGLFYQGSGSRVKMYNNDEFSNADVALSHMDCVASSLLVLATLSKQANHSQ